MTAVLKPQTPRTAGTGGGPLRAAGVSASCYIPASSVPLALAASFNSSGVVNGVVVPASNSMHESSLYKGDREQRGKTDPAMKGLDQVQNALRRDQAMQTKKYGGMDPCQGAARFHVEMPHGPQHAKYSWRSRPQTASDQGLFAPASPSSCWSSQLSSIDGGDDVSASKRFAGCRFNMNTLQAWFRDIDRDASGVITQRELVVALRQKKELLSMFCQIQGVGQIGVKDKSCMSPEMAAQTRREENYRIKEILKEVDTDNSGTMEWDEFVDFFRRAGLLLEYRTRKECNRTALCEQLEEARELEEQQTEELMRKDTMTVRRAAKDTAHEIQAYMHRVS